MSRRSKGQFGAVILAAGESSRFGGPKQLVEFRGKSLIRRITDSAIEAGCSPIVVVIGSDGEKVFRELEGTNVTNIENKSWQQGMGSSIRAGIRHLVENATDIDAAILLVCDQPAVDAQAIVRLIRLRKTTKKEIIASSYANTLGVPALFARSFFCELLSLGDRVGAKSIILRNRERVVQVPFPEGKIDIDSWSDYEILRSSVRSRAGDRSWAAEESPE
jgi:molybdenum cofactor cytidylyltransferase